MSARSFFDTNLLIYADNQGRPAKQRRALELITKYRRERTGVVSLQVPQEYFVTVTPQVARGCRCGPPEGRIARGVRGGQSGFGMLAAIDQHRLHGFSFWDALVLRAAKQSACSVLFSEDFQAGREIDGIRIVDPFRQ